MTQSHRTSGRLLCLLSVLVLWAPGAQAEETAASRDDHPTSHLVGTILIGVGLFTAASGHVFKSDLDDSYDTGGIKDHIESTHLYIAGGAIALIGLQMRFGGFGSSGEQTREDSEFSARDDEPAWTVAVHGMEGGGCGMWVRTAF